MRFFNTSGPNIPAQHYVLTRSALVAKGMQLVRNDRYFTIWAPRQTGKSTYFRLLEKELKKERYLPVHVNLEDSNRETLPGLLDKLKTALSLAQLTPPCFETLLDFSSYLHTVKNYQIILLLDEVESLNFEALSPLLHTIRSLYHSRHSHSLKSAIFGGQSKIVRIDPRHDIPFNITDDLPLPYFSEAEVAELLGQYASETGQCFKKALVEKIYETTSGHPGLVNGLASRLVASFSLASNIRLDDYREAEDLYLEEENNPAFIEVCQLAEEFRPYVERLLFTDADIEFNICRKEIELFYRHGMVRSNENGMVEFRVPLHKKLLYKAFYPYTNGEQASISATLDTFTFFKPDGELDIPKLINHYKAYAAKRGFRVFIEKNKKGVPTLKESGLIYSFETFLAAFVSEAEGKSYREADTGLGKSDLILYLEGREYLFETKKYYSPGKFKKGKKQLAHYARSLGLDKAVYLVFTPNHIEYPETVLERVEVHEGIEIAVFLVPYDEQKDF